MGGYYSKYWPYEYDKKIEIIEDKLLVVHKKIKDIDLAIINDLKISNLDISYNRLAELNLTRIECELNILDASYNNIGEIISLKIVKGDTIQYIHSNCCKILLLAHNLLTNIKTKNLPLNLEFIDASHNSITNIELYDETLKKINVSYNLLFDDPPLRFPRNLEYLDIANNKINSLNNIYFGENLQTLDLSCNKLECFTITAPKLQKLNISFNSIISLDMTSYPVLKHLDASDNLLNHITIPNSVEYLYIMRNKLKSLELDQESQLKKIDALENEISQLAIVEMPEHLTEIYLSHNQLKSFNIPNETKELKVLDLSYNNITTLTSSYTSIGLERLDISNNHVPELPLLPTTLRFLDAAYNKLTVINRLPKTLTTLDVTGCPIKRIDIQVNVNLKSVNGIES